MCFRIGINLGDVIADDERIDGVNIAGRIDALAEPAVSPVGTQYRSAAELLSFSPLARKCRAPWIPGH